MEKITVKKTKLVKILLKNRENHRKVFEEALEGYKEAVIAHLEKNLEDAKANRNPAGWLRFSLIQPVDQTKNYDTALRMLEMHTKPEIELQEHEFRQYVEDEWNWSRSWAMSNQHYIKSAAGTTVLAKYSGHGDD